MQISIEIDVLQQYITEETYGRHNIRKVMKKDVMKLGRVMFEAIVEVVDTYLNGKYATAKETRVNHVKNGVISVGDLVIELMILVLQSPTHSMQGLVGKLAGILGFDDEFDGIQTAAEIIGAVCHVDLYDIKVTASGGMQVRSRYSLTKPTAKFISKTRLLPPMVCKPRVVVDNYTGHNLTKNQCVILGSRRNHHGNKLALDVLNIANNTALSLDLNILEHVEESEFSNPTFQKRAQFQKMVRESNEVYEYLLNEGNNRFYVGYGFDKRARMYANGYHVNPQGTEYKKAIINFANKVVITGV